MAPFCIRFQLLKRILPYGWQVEKHGYNTPMLIILGMGIGMVAGYLLRRQERLLHFVDLATTGLVYLLLFLLGVSVGGNRAILLALDELGGQALLLSSGAVVGSILLAAPLSARLFEPERHEE